jgi:hypothetical protein
MYWAAHFILEEEIRTDLYNLIGIKQKNKYCYMLNTTYKYLF